MRDHPDREQLAAWQAGELGEPDRGRTAAHLAGCGACATVVAELETARDRLALLAEPELPAGLHERLLAAVEREAARSTRARSTPARRRSPWLLRPGTWAAAAVLVLFVVGVLGLVSLADRSRDESGTAAAPASRQDDSGAAGGAGGEQAPEAATSGGRLPVVRLAGVFSPDRLQEAADSSRATKTGPLSSSRSGAPAPQGAADQYGTTGQLPPDQQACVDQATAQAGATRLTPAFFVETTYQGRSARLLVATVAGSPGQARYFVFPPGNCSAAPVAQGQASIR